MTEARAGELIAAIAERGDRSAFIALFEYYAPRLKSQAMRFGLTADQAEDVAQDAMLLVWTRAAQFNPARGAASSWIFTISAHLRVDLRRRIARRRIDDGAPPEAVDGATPETLAESADEAERVGAALAGLSDEQRRVVELSFFTDEAHGAIAARLGIPVGTVKSRIRLALKRLRDLMEGTR